MYKYKVTKLTDNNFSIELMDRYKYISAPLVSWNREAILEKIKSMKIGEYYYEII